jgi:hypothetical protein
MPIGSAFASSHAPKTSVPQNPRRITSLMAGRYEAERFPKVEFEVFAGHTHSPAPVYRPVQNLTVTVDGAEYGNPKISRVLEFV